MVGALILGLVAGFIARAVIPNDAFESLSGPKSWVVSIVLGTPRQTTARSIPCIRRI